MFDVSSYATQALVLKKTKLKEKDLIVTLLAVDGRQIRAVAKGARRPGSKATANVELFCVSELLLSGGRTLDVVCEAQASKTCDGCRADLEHSAAASVVCELLEKVTRDADAEPRLFALGVAALQAIASAEHQALVLLVAATIIKIAAQIGLRPTLEECANCGRSLAYGQGETNERERYDERRSAGDFDEPDEQLLQDQANRRGAVDEQRLLQQPPAFFSIPEGGVVCEQCAPLAAPGLLRNQAEMIAWLRLVLYSRYDEILKNAGSAAPHLQQRLLDLTLDWTQTHLGLRLTSVRVLQGLF